MESLGVLFGIEKTTLRQFLQNKARPRPHFDTLGKIATIIGCDTSLFMESQNGQRDEIDEGARAFADVMLHLGIDLTPDERAPIIEMAKAMASMKRKK